MWKTYILPISILVMFVAGAVFLKLNNSSTQSALCTMEAKVCPDGSAVGRTGSNCEFSPCPKVSEPPVAVTRDLVLGVGQKGKVGALDIMVNAFISDSRCPVDVQCIWAGELKVKVTLANPSGVETREMSSIEGPYTFDGYNISIVSVLPVPKSTTKIAEKEYSVTFRVDTNTLQ